jgi:hypothetical protein
MHVTHGDEFLHGRADTAVPVSPVWTNLRENEVPIPCPGAIMG